MSFLASLWTIARAQPIAATLAVSTLGAGVTGVGMAGYWVYGQPNPIIVAVEAPVTNGGLQGVTTNGRAPYVVPPEVRPVPKTVFRGGETMWTVRHDCFLFKTSGPLTRTLRGKKTGTVHTYPLMYPPTRTEGCARRNFPTPLPEVGSGPGQIPEDDYTYEVAVLFYKNPLQPEVRTLFPSVDITVVRE